MPAHTPSKRSVTPAVRNAARRMGRWFPRSGLTRLPVVARRQSVRTTSTASANGPARAVAPLRGSGPR